MTEKSSVLKPVLNLLVSGLLKTVDVVAYFIKIMTLSMKFLMFTSQQDSLWS